MTSIALTAHAIGLVGLFLLVLYCALKAILTDPDGDSGDHWP